MAGTRVASGILSPRGPPLNAHGRTPSESIPTAPGKSRGTNVAEVLAEIAVRVQQECYGADSRHE